VEKDNPVWEFIKCSKETDKSVCQVLDPKIEKVWNFSIGKKIVDLLATPAMWKPSQHWNFAPVIARMSV